MSTKGQPPISKPNAKPRPANFLDTTVESLSNFDPGVVGRGFQLTFVGAYRALQNPDLFQSDHYKQAVIAVAAGLALRILLSLPALVIRIVVFVLGIFIDLTGVTWDDKLINGIDFLEKNVLQLPLFLMSLMRHLSPALDEMFMESLRWVDYTYTRKHRADDPSTLRAQYYPNLVLWSQQPKPASAQTAHKSTIDKLQPFLVRSGTKAGISLGVYILSFVPYIGRFVLPAASFYSLNKAAGMGPAAVVSIVGLFSPRRYIVAGLQAYYASRALMRELLVPYFSRLHYTPEQKRRWFQDREGLLFGFAVGFYLLIRLPLFGVLLYGIAEASTAYLITKITDPPPPPSQNADFVESQVRWRAKEDFMQLSLANLDHLNEKMVNKLKLAHSPSSSSILEKEYADPSIKRTGYQRQEL